MALTDYLTAPFKQATLVKEQLSYKPEVASGFCYGLFNTWIKLAGPNGTLPTAAGRMDHLNANYSLAATRQLVYKSGAGDTHNNDHADQIKTLWSSSTSKEFATVLTELGKHSGWTFRFFVESALRENLATVAASPKAKNRIWYVSIKFNAKGGHALGLIPGEQANLLFDANAGEFAFTDGQSAAFVADLWAAYANTRGGIANYGLYVVTPEETVQQKWEAGKMGAAAAAAGGIQPVATKLDPSRFQQWSK